MGGSLFAREPKFIIITVDCGSKNVPGDDLTLLVLYKCDVFDKGGIRHPNLLRYKKIRLLLRVEKLVCNVQRYT